MNALPVRTLGLATALLVLPSLVVAQNAPRPWTHPITAWGDPDLTGMWPVTHLNGTPVQRPTQFGDRRTLTDQEFAERQKQIAVTTERTAGAWAEIGQANRLTSLVVEPANGRLPPLTDEGRRRSTTMTSSWSDMLFNRIEDFNALDRCMTRGLPASMFPFMYNSGIEIVQAPGYVVIRLEIVHETRIIPLDPSTSLGAGSRPRLSTSLRHWLGDSRGRWEGKTLVVETTNFNGRFPMMIQGPGGGAVPTSESLRVVERFTRTDEDTIEYELSVEDPIVLTGPWKAAFPWKRDPTYYIYEYACHEGNQAISNALRNSRYLESVGGSKDPPLP
jgi:hypothetical protein